jgi:hypothetical protein
MVGGGLMTFAIADAQDKPEVPAIVPESKPEVKLEIKGEIKSEPKVEDPKLDEEPKKSEKPAAPPVSVTEKNPFRLRPPVAPSTNAVVDRTSLNLRLTGITAFSDTKKALIVMTVPGTTRMDSFILGEGEQQGVLEVVKIDAQEGTVMVKNAGEPQKLVFPSENPAASAASSTSRTSSGTEPFNPFSRFQKEGDRGGNKGGDRGGDRRDRNNPPGNPLRSVPTRGGTPSVPQAGVVVPEPARFDLVVQTTAVDARGIGTVRELPRGQFSTIPATDLLPPGK